MLSARALATATVLSIPAGASCSLGTSLAGFSGGAADGGTEASAPVVPGAEGGVAAPPTEAGTSFCASLTPAPSFCADFDEGGPPDRGWYAVTLGEGGALGLDGAVLRATAPQVSAPTTATAFLHQPLGAPDHHLHAEAKFRPMKLPGLLTPLELIQNSSSDYRALILYVGPGGAHLQEETAVGGGPLQLTVKDLPAGPPIGEWHRYAFDLDFSPNGAAGGATVSLTVDAAVVIDHLALHYPWVKTGIDLRVGLVYLITTDAAEYEVDDVVVTLE